MAMAFVIFWQTLIQAAQLEKGMALDEMFASLEKGHQANIGVYALDTGSNKEIYHADDRFAYCSTSKVLIVGALLRQENLIDLKNGVV